MNAFRSLLVFSFFSCVGLGGALGQHLGIRKDNPQQALDVNGNIQLTGTIKPNGQVGSPGQVLTSTGTGLAWANLAQGEGGFYRWAVFSTVTSGVNWNVPAGVSEVMVEIWGGGGGGSAAGDGAGGAGSGAYSRAIIDVNNVSSLTVVVGAGANGNSQSNASGGNASEVRWTRLATNYRIHSAGGEGASAGAAGAGGPIVAGNTVVPSNISLFQMPGSAGEPVFSYYSSSNAGIVYRVVAGTPGGTAFSFEGFPQPGGTYGFNPNDPNTSNSIFGSDSGGNVRMPGQGGSSNIRSTNRNANGANGLVIIRW